MTECFYQEEVYNHFIQECLEKTERNYDTISINQMINIFIRFTSNSLFCDSFNRNCITANGYFHEDFITELECFLSDNGIHRDEDKDEYLGVRIC